MKTSEINKKYPEAYYPRYDPALHTKMGRKRYHLKKRPNIYEKDSTAYYGPSARYETISSNKNEGKKVKIIMKDLSEVIPSKEKIQELQRQLNNLNNFILLPKNLMRVDKERSPYFNDPSAYYDPTKSDIIRKRRSLIKRINKMQKSLRKLEGQKGEVPNPFKYEKAPEKIFVENRTNSKVEEYNKSISNMLSEEDAYNKVNNKSAPTSAPASPSLSVFGVDEKSKNNIRVKSNLNTNTNQKGITYKMISSNY